MLINRGITDPQVARDFLHPRMLTLHDPALLGNMAAATDRIARAIGAREKIVIYGDYDVDGITATAILWHAITILGGDVHYYIPHRLDEGYGINSDAIAQVCDQGAQLIISVDCGITAIEPVALACERGVDVIITDHHNLRPDGDLPNCLCIIHPRINSGGTAYPNPDLCGSGVALKLAWATGLRFSGGNGKVSDQLRELLLNATSLAALATIADVVPLVGENRVIAHFGLLGLKRCALPGVQALIQSAGLSAEKLDTYHVGFQLAPRLNACGRMGHAADAVEMLTTATAARAREIAIKLEKANAQRKSTEKQIAEQAMRQIEELGLDAPDNHAIVVGADGWHAGVVGIVASRIVDRFHRPAIVLSFDGEAASGSGRSIAGFHLAKALADMGDLLQSSGGHDMAAGLSLKRADFEAFRRAFADHAAKLIVPDQLRGELCVEAEAGLADLTIPLMDQMQLLAPFGQGNPNPILCSRNVELVREANPVGAAGEHLQLTLRQGNSTVRAIAFKFGLMADQLKRGSRLDIAFAPTLNTYNGNRSVEMDVKDIHPARISEPVLAGAQ